MKKLLNMFFMFQNLNLSGQIILNEINHNFFDHQELKDFYQFQDGKLWLIYDNLSSISI